MHKTTDWLIAIKPHTSLSLDFQYLPAYADFLKEHLEEYVREQLALSKAVKVPILKYFENWPEDQLIRLAMETSSEFLQYLSDNKAKEQIEKSVKRWLENQLPIIQRDNVVADDITLINYVRKQTFLKFLPMYTSDLHVCINISAELDRYILELEQASFNTYFQLQFEKEKEIAARLAKSEEMLLEAQELAGIGSFEWNLILDEATVTPQLNKILEIKNSRLKEFMSHVHPDDLSKMKDSLGKAISQTGVYDSEFRYVVDGKEKVLWSRGKVHYDDGKAISITGTIMDVTQRHELVSRLQLSEQLFKQSQALTHHGNYTWDVLTNTFYWSDEMFRLYGLSPTSDITYEIIARHTHPDDIELVRNEMQEAIRNKEPFNFFFRIITTDKSEKILLAKGEILFDNDKPIRIIGTAQDVTVRQNLIRRLQESEALYKEAQAISHVGNWTMDIATRKLHWSDEMFRIYGRENKSEVSYEEFLEMIHPADRNRVNYHINKSIESGKDYDLLHRIVLPDGTLKIVHRKGRVETNNRGERTQIVGTTQDVTEYKKIEKELLENRNFIQKIADATPSIIASYNVNTGKYRFISEGLNKLLGYSPQQGMREGIEFFTRIIHPDDLKALMEKNAQALEQANENKLGDTIVEFRYRMLHRNGQYRWFHTYGTIFDRNPEGKVEHVLNISIDITERMEAEKKIVEQEYFIKQIIDASPTILYLFAVKEASVIYINREIENVLGYKPEELLAMGDQVVTSLYHPVDAVEMAERLKQYNNKANPRSLFQFECRMKHKNGDWRFMLVREIVFRRNESGKITEVLGSALDITQRKTMEEQLFHQTIALQQSNTSLEEFAYVASHDLKEPLRKISTFGDRIMSAQKDKWEDESLQYLEKIVSSSKRMQLMINDLLSISMISGNKRFEKYSLQAIVEDVKQALEHKIEESKAIIEVSALPEANIVPSQFRQLFQNLISNSLKFMKPGVQPVVRIKHNFMNPKEIISLKLAKANRYLKIEVADNGIGFDNVFSDRIFSIFQRLHSKSEYEGTGIGLAICKKIVENHGGLIYASGEQNEGSTFTIIIPV